MSDYLLTWAGEERPRWEQARVDVGLGRMRARGTVLVGGEAPYRVDYELDTVAGLVTRRLLVRVSGLGVSQELLLTRDQDGEWATRRTTEPAGSQLGGTGGTGAPHRAAVPEPLDAEELRAALDCDLAMSPLTNTMPALRHALHRREGRQEFVMAFVSLPDLAVTAAAQTYEHLRTRDSGGVVRYSSGTFEAEISFDGDGFVTAYPGVGHRV